MAEGTSGGPGSCVSVTADGAEGGSSRGGGVASLSWTGIVSKLAMEAVSGGDLLPSNLAVWRLGSMGRRAIVGRGPSGVSGSTLFGGTNLAGRDSERYLLRAGMPGKGVVGPRRCGGMKAALRKTHVLGVDAS